MRFVIDGGDNCAGSKYSDDATNGGKFFGSHASTTPNLFGRHATLPAAATTCQMWRLRAGLSCQERKQRQSSFETRRADYVVRGGTRGQLTTDTSDGRNARHIWQHAPLPNISLCWAGDD